MLQHQNRRNTNGRHDSRRCWGVIHFHRLGGAGGGHGALDDLGETTDAWNNQLMENWLGILGVPLSNNGETPNWLGWSSKYCSTPSKKQTCQKKQKSCYRNTLGVQVDHDISSSDFFQQFRGD